MPVRTGFTGAWQSRGLEGNRADTKKAHLSMSPSFACLRGEAFTNKSQSEWENHIAHSR